MTVSVVQAAIITQAGGSWSGNFPVAVTPGNSVVLLADAAQSGAGLSTGSPTYNGAAVTGATRLWDAAQGASSSVGCAGWLLPNVSGSSQAVALTYTGGANFGSGVTGLWALEVAGLGASPTVVSPAASAGTAGTALSSGATGSATGAGIGVGCAVAFAKVFTPSAGWTELTQMSSAFGGAAYQLLSSGAVTYGGTIPTAANGVAGAAIILSSATPPASPSGLLMASII